MKFLGSSEHEAVVATNSSQVRLYNLKTMDCQLLSAHSGTEKTYNEIIFLIILLHRKEKNLAPACNSF